MEFWGSSSLLALEVEAGVSAFEAQGFDLGPLVLTGWRTSGFRI